MGVLPRVVIVGAGFAGIEVAHALADAPVEVVLVDRNNFHTFQPLLYQVATSGLNAADVAHATRGLFHRQRNVDVLVAEVIGVDWDARSLLLEAHAPLEFDHLVLAAGATVSFFGTPGAAEHAFPLYTLHDAIRLRNHVIGRFEAAAADPSLIADGALNVVVVGGGPTGVETAGAMSELFSTVFRKDYPRLDMSRARVVLLEVQPRLLPPFSKASAKHAADALFHMRVEVRTDERVAAIDAGAVTLGSGEVIRAQTLVWAAGVRANPLADVLGLEQGPGGRIIVEPDLSVKGHAGVWAVGDLAHAMEKGTALPQLAPVALQGGRHVGRQIKRVLEGTATRPFHYRDKGTMATIGRRSAVAELPIAGIKLQGTLGWLSWLGLHLYYLVGPRNRVSVMLSWAWNYLTFDRGPRLLLQPDDDVR